MKAIAASIVVLAGALVLGCGTLAEPSGHYNNPIPLLAGGVLVVVGLGVFLLELRNKG